MRNTYFFNKQVKEILKSKFTIMIISVRQKGDYQNMCILLCRMKNKTNWVLEFRKNSKNKDISAIFVKNV